MKRDINEVEQQLRAGKEYKAKSEELEIILNDKDFVFLVIAKTWWRVTFSTGFLNL